MGAVMTVVLQSFTVFHCDFNILLHDWLANSWWPCGLDKLIIGFVPFSMYGLWRGSRGRVLQRH